MALLPSLEPDFVLPISAQPVDCAAKAAAEAIRQSPYPRIQVGHFRGVSRVRTTMNALRGYRAFDFDGWDDEGHRFNGSINLEVLPYVREEPLSGEKAKFLGCSLPANLLFPNLVLRNVNGTPIFAR